MKKEYMNSEWYFDIEELRFDNVSDEFERAFRIRYKNSMNGIFNNDDRFANANAINSLIILKKMAFRLDEYDKESEFNPSFHNILKEAEQFTET